MDIVKQKPLSHGRTAYLLREQVAPRLVLWHVRVSDTEAQRGMRSSWRTKALALANFDAIEEYESAGASS